MEIKKRKDMRILLLFLILTVTHTVSGVINCIEARHQCKNDPQCKNVLEMLHKICGPELVACATVTPGKCKTLLRTLGQYDYLQSCTCREAHIDFNCYTFREMIFNHPCSLVETTDEQQGHMQTCTAANSECKGNRQCLSLYMDFLEMCKYDDYTCTSEHGDKCLKIWNKIRTTSLFGCYCPVPARPKGQYVGHHDTLTRKEEECSRFYNDTHENPCLAGQKNMNRATMVETSQAMCHVALDHCTKDEECSEELNNINTWCDHSHCEPERCRKALQDFYQRVKVVRRLQVAFCVCRQSDHDGECLMAMRKLHPTCAERNTPKTPMQCHMIAEQCRQNRVCSAKLQEYEENCAADAMTGRCSDSHRKCQEAVMNILGTELHATCVCKGTDFLHQQDCYTWQKLLWSNPCVIESHLKLHEEIDSGASDELEKHFRRRPTPPPATSTPAPHHAETHDFGSMVYTPEEANGHQIHQTNWGNGRGSGVSIGQGGRGFDHSQQRGTFGNYNPPVQQPKYPTNPDSHFERGRNPKIAIFKPTNLVPHVGRGRAGEHGGGYGNGYRGTMIPIPSQEPHRVSLGGNDWGRGGVPRRPVDILTGGRFEDVDRETYQRSTVRPYHRTPPSYQPITPTPGSPRRPSNKAPAPSNSTSAPTNEYTLGPGIYLFLGYSRGEVELLEPYTSKNEHDAVKVLESVLVRDYGFQCELTTKHHIGENFIVVAKLQVNPDIYIPQFVKQREEKEKCAGPLQEIAKKINSRPRHEDIRTDAILSMFVLAKVDVNLPEPHTLSSSSSPLFNGSPIVLALLACHLIKCLWSVGYST